MSSIFSKFFGWVNSVDNYRNNHGNSVDSHPAFYNNKQSVEIRESYLNFLPDVPNIKSKKETDLMIADLVPPHSFINRYYLTWHSLSENTDDVPGVPSIYLFNNFEDALQEYENRVETPFGKTFVVILWCVRENKGKKLLVGAVDNYDTYKEKIPLINEWMIKNIKNAKVFGNNDDL